VTKEEVNEPLRLVVGIDATPESIDALVLSRLLASGLGAQIDAVAVLPGGRAGQAMVPEQEAKDAYFEPLFELADRELGMAYEPHRVEGVSASAGLTGVAERVGATAIVIGSNARGPIGRVLMGDVGAALTGGSPCAVVVAPRGYARENPQRISRVGIAYDGRPQARVAMREGVTMGQGLNASLHLLAAVPFVHPGGRIGHTSRGFERLILEDMEGTLSDAADRLGFPVARTVSVGDAADCLAEASEDLDLLVIGSRGYGPLRRVMLGGVSVRVMRSSACPVMVVPRDDP
jgi:nucleotide-binding universal stress UspA family protein